MKFSSRQIAWLRFLWSLPACAWLLFATAAPVSAEADERPSFAPVEVFVKKHCLACHADNDPKAGLSLTKFRSSAELITGRKAWDSIVTMVESGEMPPADKPQPTADERTAFLKQVADIIADDERRSPPNPGRVTMRRLNRAEYDNTVRDLFYGLDINASEDFPSDDIGHGFDNIGDVLTMSPVLMERYLAAAGNISKLAILTSIPPVNKRGINMQYTQPSGRDVPLSGSYRVVTVKPDATPVESGPLFAQFQFNPNDDYVLKFSCYAERDQAIDVAQTKEEKPLDLDAVLDGKPSKKKAANAVAATDGEPIRVAAFVYGKDLPDGASDDEVSKLYGAAWTRCRPCRILQIVEVKSRSRDKTESFEVKIPPMPGIQYIGVSVVKPSEGQPPTRVFFKSLGVDGPLDMRPYSMRRTVEAKPDQSPQAKTREVLTRFASRAFRRPATEQEVDRLVKIVESVESSGGKWEAGLQLAVQAVLASPKFLFRAELDDRPTAPDTRPIDEYQLASRLSYFLWSSMPDDELFELAAKNQLTANLDVQIRRMLLDPKAKSLVEEFAMQWLQLDRLRTHSADATIFPSFGEPLRNAMIKETQLFLEAIIREDRPISDIITADFTFLNKTMADHYGIADTMGNRKNAKSKIPGGQLINSLLTWQRVQLPPGSPRGGLLTQASILTVSSNPTRTSPVKRGKWVLEQLLGAPPPPPPAAVPELEEQKDKLSGTLRQQMEQHRKNPACANCHAKMDPLGFAFENFNAIGGYREEDAGAKIDASGELPDGRTFQGPAELKKILSEKKREFARCLAEKLLTFALGRGLEYYDRRAVDKIVLGMEQNEFKFSALCVEIARSDPFRLRRGVEAAATAAR